MGNSPLISVIVPVYNAEKYVAEAITSILRQDYAPLEIIVIDDGSTDDSVKIIESLGDDLSIISQSNRGPAAARNKGLEKARGDFFAFLDADDLWSDHKLSHQLACLMDHPQIEVVWGRTQYFGDFSERDKKVPLEDDQTAVNYQFGSGLFRRVTFERVGLFDEESRISEDYDWLMRAREMAIPFYLLDEIVLFFRMHQKSTTHAEETRNFQFPLLLKKSMDRRHQRTGRIEPLPKMPDKQEHVGKT